VVLSSGVAELDDAAIRWTQQAHFLPAEHDHKAVDGTMNFAVKFQLDDRATSQWWSP
jgi:outer membrane biosynthesis protein TonB